ncbi:MAG TPA: hypothetical protein VFN87_00420 [Solirubrobacteraceae bacterium]|nr:hypothetical protein [Solirubrobacteraceae bacterium]
MLSKVLTITCVAAGSACAAAPALAATPALAAAPAAHAARHLPARIVLHTSIAGFRLGVTPRAVERRLGRPSQTIRVSGRIAQLTYNRAGLGFAFDTLQRSDPADDITAYIARYHTSKGIRVGASEKAVKRAYHGLHCQLGLCDLYQGTPGTVGSSDTAFTFFRGKLDTIQVQKVFE